MDGSSGPLVSIITPTYNYGRYISKCISSCLQQTYRNIEMVVVDDGSTDDTGDVVKQFGEGVRYISQENQGVSAARNTGLKEARGTFIAFLDVDDYLLPDSIARRVEVLQKFPDVGIVFSDTYSVTGEADALSRKATSDKDVVSDRFYEDLLLRHLRFQTSAAMIRASIAKQFSFPLHLANGEDLVYFAKIFFATKGYFINTPTVVNLHHEDSLRHDVEEILRQDMAFVDTILDDPYYNGRLEYIRKDLTSQRHLELFRRLYLSGKRERAWAHYVKAVSIKPGRALKVSYLSKALRLLLKGR